MLCNVIQNLLLVLPAVSNDNQGYLNLLGQEFNGFYYSQQVLAGVYGTYIQDVRLADYVCGKA